MRSCLSSCLFKSRGLLSWGGARILKSTLKVSHKTGAELASGGKGACAHPLSTSLHTTQSWVRFHAPGAGADMAANLRGCQVALAAWWLWQPRFHPMLGNGMLPIGGSLPPAEGCFPHFEWRDSCSKPESVVEAQSTELGKRFVRTTASGLLFLSLEAGERFVPSVSVTSYELILCSPLQFTGVRLSSLRTIFVSAA